MGLKQETIGNMLTVRRHKYKWFIRALHSFRYLSMSRDRADFLESYYSLMRYLDDVVDGDAPLPAGYGNSREFVLEKIAYAQNLGKPKDRVEHLMLECNELGKRFNTDFTDETNDILTSMLFDASRYKTSRIFSQQELDEHFQLLDVRGTISASLKVFGEDPQKCLFLEPLGIATRIYYTLRDYDEDMGKGFVNVSAEDCDCFKISGKNLEDRLSSPVQAWMKAQAEHGQRRLNYHKMQLNSVDFGLLVRATLQVVYANPARRFFERMLC
jgi:hypothetical protein